jgi:hypothetical protein
LREDIRAFFEIEDCEGAEIAYTIDMHRELSEEVDDAVAALR